MDGGLDCLWPRLFVHLRPHGTVLDPVLPAPLPPGLNPRGSGPYRTPGNGQLWDATHWQERLGPPAQLARWLRRRLDTAHLALGLAAHPLWAQQASRGAGPGAIAFRPPWLAGPPRDPRPATPDRGLRACRWSWVLPPRTVSRRTLARYLRRACALAAGTLERDCLDALVWRLVVRFPPGRPDLTAEAGGHAALIRTAGAQLGRLERAPVAAFDLQLEGLVHRYGQGDLFGGDGPGDGPDR